MLESVFSRSPRTERIAATRGPDTRENLLMALSYTCVIGMREHAHRGKNLSLHGKSGVLGGLRGRAICTEKCSGFLQI